MFGNTGPSRALVRPRLLESSPFLAILLPGAAAHHFFRPTRALSRAWGQAVPRSSPLPALHAGRATSQDEARACPARSGRWSVARARSDEPTLAARSLPLAAPVGVPQRARAVARSIAAPFPSLRLSQLNPAHQPAWRTTLVVFNRAKDRAILTSPTEQLARELWLPTDPDRRHHVGGSPGPRAGTPATRARS